MSTGNGKSFHYLEVDCNSPSLVSSSGMWSEKATNFNRQVARKLASTIKMCGNRHWYARVRNFDDVIAVSAHSICTPKDCLSVQTKLPPANTASDRCWGRGELACQTSSHKRTSKLDGRVWESCDTSVLCTSLFTTAHIFLQLHFPGPFGTAERSPVQQILGTPRLKYTYYGHHSVCHTSTHNYLRPHTWPITVY